MKALVCFLFLLAGVLGVEVKSGIGGRIIGGDDAYRGEYPSVISLEFCIRGTCQHACAGAVISQSWILTAAHCFTDVPSQGSFRVIAGIINLDDTTSDRQIIRVSHAFIPSSYGGGPGPNDIAVLKLVSSLVLNDVVQPIRIVSSGYPATGVGTVVGWGAIGGTITPIMPNTQQSARVPILSYDECASALDTLLNSNHPFDLNSNTCTGPLNGIVSSCTGDSGDPLIQDNTLLGVVSWAVTPCGTVGAPSTIQTRLYPFRSWIASVIDESLLP